MTLYEDCKITEDEDGIKHAASVHGVLSVLPDGETRVFMRNAIKMGIAGGESGRFRMLVGELDGVRVYVCGDKVTLTKRDLYF
jgi:hypothetical protein